MALYLNNLDLNGNQLIKATVHPLGTAPNSAQEGQIYYNTADNVVYVNTSTTPNSPSWVSMGGDITGVSFTTDDSTTISDTSGNAAFTIAGGTGVTTSSTGSTVTITVDTLNQSTTGSAGSVANALTVDDTTVKLSSGTTYNGSSALTLSAKTASIADGGAALATADQIHTFVTGASTTGNAGTVTNATFTTALTVNTGTLTLTANNANNSVVTIGAGAVGISGSNTGDQTLPTDFVSAANGGTFSGNVSFGDNHISNVGIITVDEVQADGTSIKIGDQASKTITLGRANTTTSGSPTSPSVQTAVSVLGDLAVAGNLTISGDLTTVSTSNTAIKDTIIVLNAGHTATQEKDIAVLFERGSETNVAFRWDEDQATFDLIATSAAGNEATGAILPADPNGNGENVAGTANFQNLRVNAVSAPGGFTGVGSGLTTLNGSNISSGTVAAARVGNLATSKITSGTFADARISSGSVTQHEGSIDHDALTNFASDEHFTQANITTVGTIGTGVWQGSVIASAYLDSDTAHLTTAQTFSGAKTFSGGIVLDDGSGASPVLKFKNEADTHWTVQNDNSNNLKFTQATDLRVTFNAGGTVTIPGDIDLGGDIDVDGTMEADAITLQGNSVHATDTTNTLGTSDTVVPSQNAVKTYVDAQTSGDSNTGGRQAFVLAAATSGVAATSTTVFTITHGMGASRNYGVEVIRNSANSGGGETVIVDVARPTDTTITITFAAAPTVGDYTALVCKY